jgi:hypothetical protein
MASSHCAALAADNSFQIRVDYFLKKAAIAVMAESSSTTNHDIRVVFGREIFDGRQRIYDFALGITTNSTIATTISTSDPTTANAAISDNDLEFTVNSMYDAYAM